MAFVEQYGFLCKASDLKGQLNLDCTGRILLSPQSAADVLITGSVRICQA
jgi:hypothetical protein